MRLQQLRLQNITLRLVLVMGVAAGTVDRAWSQEWKSGVEWQQPPTVTPGLTNDHPPSDAIVLFDGTSLEAWQGGDQWRIEDGHAIPQRAEIVSKQNFGDMQLHIEWSAPTDVRGSGQGRGNSGIFLMGLYEVQILDSWDNETYFDGQAASIYKQTPPMVNAMRKPGEWNSYDIFFTVPRFKGNGDVQSPGYVTLVHNGVLALNHFELMGPTSYTEAPHYQPHAEEGPVSLQFHGDPVRFRNIWVRSLKPPVGKRTGPPFQIQPKKKSAASETDKADSPAKTNSPDQPDSVNKKDPAAKEDQPKSEKSDKTSSATKPE